MGIFNWGKAGKVAEGIGTGISTASEGIRYLLSGDLPPETRVKLIEIQATMQKSVTDLASIDAKSSSGFQAWWRPGLGWVCVISLSFYFIPQYVAGAYFWIDIIKDMSHEEILKSGLPAYPVKADAILELVLALLGMGTLRTIERFGGVGK